MFRIGGDTDEGSSTSIGGSDLGEKHAGRTHLEAEGVLRSCL
jgi:thiamine monophosphate kinase